MSSFRSLVALALTVLVGFVITSTTQFSSATYVASSSATAQITAASDWTPPTVSVVNPGSIVKETASLTVNAADGESGIRDVVVEYLAPSASTWTAICTDTTAPYSCAWDTKVLGDGVYSLRARATDRAGYETISEVVRTSVANKLYIELASPGDVVRGSVPLTATVQNVGSLSHTVRIEYTPSGTTAWKSICTNLSSPYTCAWNTTGVAAGDYDLRAVLVTGSTSTYSALIEEVTVDNAAPVVSMVDPGSPLSGSRTFAATASDAQSGLDKVVIQYVPAAGGAYRDLCTITAEPWNCRVATTTLADGTYSFRAVATDLAGNSATSAAIPNRVVDNSVASVSVDLPAALTGTVTIGATASASAGIASVRIQYATSGSGTWRDLCTDTSSPYSCSWNTTSVTDGAYDLRAILTDTANRTTTSAVETGLVDNSPLRGIDVQTANGGGTAGRADAGDTVTLTYSTQIDTTKVIAGWTGAGRSVTVRLRDGGLLLKTGKDDTLDVLASGATVNLGSINLKQDYVKGLGTTQVNATMTAGTSVGANGLVRSTITLRLDSVASGSNRLRTVSTAAAMIWTPSASVTDLQGRACSTAAVTETGASDREF
ncbi:Ig-like domain-containing protein [Nocardioides sp. Bht2]|uniref:Ig-like domain-containing protein n=1 Tax=Nocardioides sp. Bht2 TaxID=3392297 RepID=UPI0039B43B70